MLEPNIQHSEYNEYDEYEHENVHESPSETNRLQRKSKRFRHSYAELAPAKVQPSDSNAHEFRPSFTGTKHERQWIMEYLGPFYDDHVISDVLRQVKGGKEATVYCCRANPALGAELLAAKVYRPRMFRQLRNDAVYRQGRAVLDDEGKEAKGRREKLAMQKKTAFGQVMRHTTWLTAEIETLRRLYAAGADVPKPFASSDNAIVMEYLGDEDMPAPALSNVRLEPNVAPALWKRLMENVELMLAHDRVHGDLSAYNVLYWDGNAKIIDLPQAVDPYKNPDAFALLKRDVERLYSYFERYGVTANPSQIARELWERRVLQTPAVERV